MTEQGLAVISGGNISMDQLKSRLLVMQENMDAMQAFFKGAMKEGQDYGVIPGTKKPTLLKAGAEKLCEIYGLSITMATVEEEKDRATGYYRAKFTVRLVSRASGEVVAEGVGEANTMEARYRWRWVSENNLPKSVNKDLLESQERWGKNGSKYLQYRMENDDLFTLWNTVLKMAKKRATVDAVLSATRLSGIFAQDLEDLASWKEGGMTIDAEFEVMHPEAAESTAAPAPTPPAETPKVSRATKTTTVKKSEPAPAPNTIGSAELTKLTDAAKTLWPDRDDLKREVDALWLGILRENEWPTTDASGQTRPVRSATPEEFAKLLEAVHALAEIVEEGKLVD